ncbi:FAD dependent oxidoreductase-domain-containing protein [Annulohypoxylon truncatum]|uniref:FAD dependent oxidoreductase-domain-containing protein n=1 Tax=Annulohypoxylon truncatum TaxID=327061 RepID=UPI002007EAAA|nr:FAD dependent oxidoreductase-domain-containing protein [Annulohypoxylon truncatum]KAI1210521.1 FAD dependent oxidoreductase-domain-containing protein [Annulohypoxylon truncatum]
MSTSDDTLLQYVGQIVPRSFQHGLITVSYVVSCVGAILTLELLNRRTSRNGLANYLLLVSAAVSMGGISIWCMHFTGNRAIVLAHNEPELRIVYSSGFSALSFFAPVIVLLATFVAIGASYKVSWWRLCCGGVLAGTSISGMHYLGNLSINNYDCVYNAVYVTGAAIIAIFDSTVALSLFFVFRASWRNTWWKRAISAFVLAGAVSGMHWVAAVGTQYRLVHLNERDKISQSQDLRVAASLSIIAVFFIIASIVYESWLTKRRENKAQQIVLGVAVFDKSGRILVSPDGLLPSEKITDTYVERTQGDIFSISHPLFHWMFQVSRSWNSVNGMIDGMINHLAHLPKGSRDGKIRLIADDGQPIENYDAIFRELFCVAAASLADKLKEQLADVGILWDDILATGTNQLPQKLDQGIVDCTLEEGTYGQFRGRLENGIMRQHEYGRGSLMFLVRHLEHAHDVNRLEAAGFRFAEIHQVCGIIGSRMQIKTRDLKGKLTNMATFAEGSAVMRPGVHLGFFGVKAQVGSFGFDIVVKKGTRNLLPTMPIPIERLESWQMEIIRHFDRMNVGAIFHLLDELKKLSPREVLFASQMYDALQALRAWIDDPIVDDAVMTSKVVQVPCRAQGGSSSAKFCTMIALCIMMPIHVSASSPRCEFIPLNFFKVHQMAYKDSSQLAAFARYVHRELSPIANSAPVKPPGGTYQQAGRAIFSHDRLGFLRHLGRSKTNNYDVMGNNYPNQIQSSRGSSSHDSDHASSTIKLCNQDSQYRERLGSDAMSDRTGSYQPTSLAGLGGIMVSQEIQVDISQIDDPGRKLSVPSKAVTSTDRVTMVMRVFVRSIIGCMMRDAHVERKSLTRTPFSSTMSSRLARGLRRIALPTTIAAVGGGALLYTYRPRNIPGFEGPAVPPPIYGADGTFKLPRFPKVKSREEQIAELRKSNGEEEEYDMLVIGGGATGAGVALDAVTRGLKVAVVERDDFSSGTSSKSTKLVHGGVRYLEKAVWNLDYSQYQLVKEALKERKYFLQTAPHLSSWLPIMLPLDKWWKAPYYWAGTKFYDFLAGSEGIESSYFLTRSKALDAFPMLKQTDLVGALVYYDGAHNDSRMNVSIAMTAAIYGATVLNHAEVTGLIKNDKGRLSGAQVKDLIPERNGKKSEPITVKAKCIVNCTGPFTDSIRKLDDQDCKEIVAPASGVHVILPGYYSPSNMGLIDPSTSDGRVIFFLPWQGNTIAGTTDEPTQISPNPLPDEKSIQWILNEVSHYLSPDISVRRGDVLAAWAGIRPLVKDPKAKNTQSLVRNHLVDISDSGLVTCAGGKWTTYRQMAEDCVDAAVKEFNLPTKPFVNAPRVSGTAFVDDGAILNGTCQTHNVRLVGAHGFSKTLFINLIQHFGVETEVAKHLTESYGDRAWTVAAMCKPTDLRFPARGERISRLYPFVDGEIRYAITNEYAQTAVDILARRTRLAFLNAQAALECLPKIIDIMSQELKWDRTRQEREWKDTVAFLQSMGLPEPMLSATRAQVEKGKLDFSSSLEYKMYSRHDKPPVAEE